MHVRLTLALTAVGGALALAGSTFAAPAFAAPLNLLTSTTQPPVLAHHAAVHAATSTTPNSTLYVNAATGTDSGTCTKAQPCATIQYAIGQAPTTAKIYVAAGQYPQQLIASGKNLTIVGAGRTQTTIDPTSLSIDSLGLSAAVDFEDATGSSLSGVTVDATAATTSSTKCPAGVLIDGESGRVASSLVKVTTEANASYNCEAGVVVASGASATISSTEVSDYGELGIACGGISGTCALTGDHAIGYGASAGGQQIGINASNDQNATITSDTSSGNTNPSPADVNGDVGNLTVSSGIFANEDTTLAVSKDISTGNDVGFDGLNSQGAWTITGNTFSRSTNITGTSPGSSQVPNGNFIGDGLDLYTVSDATVSGNTIESNAGRGINLIDTTDSTFGSDSSGDKPNIVSHNGDDGIALVEYIEFDYQYTGTSSGNTFAGNVIDSNADDGIFAGGTDSNGNPEQDDNTFSGNTMQGNLRLDAFDQSTGSGSDGTANTWTSNTCNTSSPAAICAAPIAS